MECCVCGGTGLGLICYFCGWAIKAGATNEKLRPLEPPQIVLIMGALSLAVFLICCFALKAVNINWD